MRFGVITVIWATPFSTDQLHLVQHIADLGFDAMECVVEKPGAMDIGRLRDALDATGLYPSVAMAFSPDRDVSNEDVSIRSDGTGYIKHCIDVAEQLGATIVSGPMYGPTGRARLPAGRGAS